MIKKAFLLNILLLCFSCSNKTDSGIRIKGDAFIDVPGLYYLKNGNIVVKEFKNGSLIYGVSDRFNKMQYQQSIFEAFSNDQFWTMYIDKDENIWYYCSDLQKLDLLHYDKKSKSYVKSNIADIKMPNEFMAKLNKNGIKKIQDLN